MLRKLQTASKKRPAGGLRSGSPQKWVSEAEAGVSSVSKLGIQSCQSDSQHTNAGIVWMEQPPAPNGIYDTLEYWARPLSNECKVYFVHPLWYDALNSSALQPDFHPHELGDGKGYMTTLRGS